VKRTNFAKTGPATRRTADPSSSSSSTTTSSSSTGSSSSGSSTTRGRRIKNYIRHKTEKSRFPFEHGSFEFDGYATDIPELTAAFTPLISAERLARLDAVVEQRSFDLMPILEGVYDIGNVLAVCRSTEALGIGCLGVISDTGRAGSLHKVISSEKQGGTFHKVISSEKQSDDGILDTSLTS
jgi:hypothetical protein